MSDERLSNIEASVKVLAVKMEMYAGNQNTVNSNLEAMLKSHDREIGSHDREINGNEGNPGIKGRLERIETRNRIIGALATTAVGAWIVKFVSEVWPH